MWAFNHNISITVQLSPQLSGQLDKLISYLNPNRIVGIGAVEHRPTPRPEQGERPMAKITQCKKSSGMKSNKPMKAGDPPLANYLLQDNEDGSFTILGADAAGAQVDISAVATLDPPPTSDNTAILTVDPPSGMTVACHGVLPGQALVTVTATWGDGSVGPYVITVPVEVKAGPVTGLAVTFGTPSIRV